MLKGIVFSVLAASLTAPAAQGSDVEAAAKLAAAKALYEQRADLKKNEEAIKTADLALAVADSKDQKYQVLVFKSRAQFWKGWNSVVLLPNGKIDKGATADLQKPIFKGASETAESALEVAPEYADAYYFLALNLARWGKVEANPLKRLSNLKKLNDAVEKGKTLKTFDGTPGETIDGYGFDRTHGGVYGSELNPKRNTALSLSELARAYDNAPDYPANGLYLAITNFTIFHDSKEKDVKSKLEGCRLLNVVLRKDETEYNPARIPESILELEEATELQEKTCN